jgi:hypothetical protein
LVGGELRVRDRNGSLEVVKVQHFPLVGPRGGHLFGALLHKSRACTGAHSDSSELAERGALDSYAKALAIACERICHLCWRCPPLPRLALHPERVLLVSVIVDIGSILKPVEVIQARVPLIGDHFPLESPRVGRRLYILKEGPAGREAREGRVGQEDMPSEAVKLDEGVVGEQEVLERRILQHRRLNQSFTMMLKVGGLYPLAIIAFSVMSNLKNAQ